MTYIIYDSEGNEVAIITNKNGEFSIELDTENYSIKSEEN